MIVAIDRCFYDGFSYVVGAVFESWCDIIPSYYVMSRVFCNDVNYKSGSFSREIDGIMVCLTQLNLDNVDTIIIDGYVWITDDKGNEKKGLGMCLQDAIFHLYKVKKTIVGISKTKYPKHHIKDCYEVKRGANKESLWVTCSEPYYAEHYSVMVKRMGGDFKVPDIIRELNAKMREYIEFVREDIKNELENSNPIKINFGTFDEWLEESEKRAFKCDSQDI